MKLLEKKIDKYYHMAGLEIFREYEMLLRTYLSNISVPTYFRKKKDDFLINQQIHNW